MSDWAEKLDAYLTRTKLSKRKLASELGISIKTLEKWWGHREPSPENVARIRKLLEEDGPAMATPVEKMPAPSVEDAVNAGRMAEVMAGQLLKEGERYGQVPVVVSLGRTKCPFCEHEVTQFRNCVYCGQHFAWANIPLRRDTPL